MKSTNLSGAGMDVYHSFQSSPSCKASTRSFAWPRFSGTRLAREPRSTTGCSQVIGVLFMNGDAAGYIGSIPQHYDRSLGPLIFADYAADISHRVGACNPARVLETAAGTGIVTRRLRDVLPVSVRLTATDLNPPMLEIARTKFLARGASRFPACRCDGIALCGQQLRCGHVPIRRDVLSRQRQRQILSRGLSRPYPRGPLHVQHLGFASPQPVWQNCARSHRKFFPCRSASIPKRAVRRAARD